MDMITEKKLNINKIVVHCKLAKAFSKKFTAGSNKTAILYQKMCET